MHESTLLYSSILSPVIIKLSTRLKSWVGVPGAPTTNVYRSKFETGVAPESDREREEKTGKKKELMGTRKDDVAAGKTYSSLAPK